ncbi:MAG TPA: hypothetical protein VFF27_07920 [Bacteroidia bacterium]|nr:hypothetical protein [Bacteroidia bacterium]
MPVLIYRNVIDLPGLKNNAANIPQKILLHNDWGNTWWNGIYDFHHYHSTTHKCIYMRSANLVLYLYPSTIRYFSEQGFLHAYWKR